MRRLAQDELKAWIWVRGAGGFSPGPNVVEGHDATTEIAALGIDLPLSETYAGLETS
jgi:hypothetical protein